MTTCLTAIVLPLLAPTLVGAVTPNGVINESSSIISASFEPPPRKDAPRGGTAGGGSRPSRACGDSSFKARTPRLTALSPDKHMGLSHSKHPVLYVYLPKTKASFAEFSLFDTKMNGVYQINIPITNKEGVVAINLQQAPALAKNQPYYWSFALPCNPDDRTEDLVVDGWIEYVPLSQNLEQQLVSSSSIQRISLYARNGYWYDAVATLIELQEKEPNDFQLAKTWNELLTSVGLSLNIIATAN